VVRWHYAEMLRKIMTEIPEMAFVSTFLNDSGSGFEYTMRLYPGRNGGPYIVREWNPNEAFAEAASKNVVRYYHLLRDVGKKINPDFRLIAGLRAIPEEEDVILEGMSNGIDLAMSLADKNDPIKWQKEQQLTQRGSLLFTGTSAKACYLLGIPSPWLTQQKLSELVDNELDRITIEVDPPSLAPWDINREIVKAIQLDGTCQIDDVIKKAAKKWSNELYADRLVEIWKYADKAVANFPDVPLYGTNWAFEMYRLWVRPYVPDIDKIPESERQYYQKFTMSIFNNPHNVDLTADCLWQLISVEQGDHIVNQCDEHVWEPLNTAITLAERSMVDMPDTSACLAIFSDLRDRLLAAKCYFRTLRNTAAWIAGVHGYINASSEAEKKKRLSLVRDMQDNELQNARDLLNLWQRTKIDFIPIQALGESWYIYGENLGELIEKKIALMEKHKDDLPYIDPNYMWRMPAGSGFDDKEYLKY